MPVNKPASPQPCEIPAYPELPEIDAAEYEIGSGLDVHQAVCLTPESAVAIGNYLRQMEREKAMVLACPLIKAK